MAVITPPKILFVGDENEPVIEPFLLPENK